MDSMAAAADFSASGFVPGLQLAGRFYQQAVAPILAQNWPSLRYSAALIGDGSEVLGFDSPRSMDHDWGPRLYLFLAPEDFRLAAAICPALETALPAEFAGFSVAFADKDRCQGFSAEQGSCGSVRHGVEFFTLASYFRKALSLNLDADLTVRDWLVLPENLLCGVTAGEVFHDGLGLGDIRARLAYYPHDVWLHLMAAQWTRIAQEEAFVGRCHEVGDSLGAKLILARLIRELMRLSFLQARRYAPYAKWFGSAFAALASAPVLLPLLQAALAAKQPVVCEEALCAALREVARRHNQLALTEPLEIEPSLYHDRPYLVIHGERFAAALKARIQNPELRALEYDIGSISQFVDSTYVLTSPALCRRFTEVVV